MLAILKIKFALSKAKIINTEYVVYYSFILTKIGLHAPTWQLFKASKLVKVLTFKFWVENLYCSFANSQPFLRIGER